MTPFIAEIIVMHFTCKNHRISYAAVKYKMQTNQLKEEVPVTDNPVCEGVSNVSADEECINKYQCLFNEAKK